MKKCLGKSKVLRDSDLLPLPDEGFATEAALRTMGKIFFQVFASNVFLSG